MAYTRKTRDTWQLHVLYPGPHGWEHELTEDSFREIRQRRKEYRENCPQYPTRIVCKRERIEA
jgi:hypothetical protein